MLISELLHDLGTLGPLSGPGASEHEHHVGFVSGHGHNNAILKKKCRCFGNGEKATFRCSVVVVVVVVIVVERR